MLLDQKMPGLDGLETLRQLKERMPEACVVMVTAFASVELAVDAMRLGATDFLRKPMTPEMLRGAVAAALASRPRTTDQAAGSVEEHPGTRHRDRDAERFSRRSTSRADQSGERRTRVRRHTFSEGSDDASDRANRPGGRGPRGAFQTHRQLMPGRSFWRGQAERLLSAYLWSEGRTPDSGLTVHDISRDDIDTAAAWDLD